MSTCVSKEVSMDSRGKLRTAKEAVQLIADGATVGVSGSGGGLGEPDLLIEALRQHFDETGHPRDLTLVHAFGLGDRAARGLGPVALPGLLRRVIGGHWGQTRLMAQLAEQGLIEAYNLPLGVMTLLHREIAGGRPGLISEVGLGTFVDPRVEGGKLNARTTEDIVEVVMLGGREYLWYHPYRIDVALIRGSEADLDGYLGMSEEGFYTDALALAGAAHASGGIVIAQVKHIVPSASLPPKSVKVPGPLVDVLVEHPGQWQSYESAFDPVYAGTARANLAEEADFALGPRKVIARRAVLAMKPGDVANLGVGVPDGVGVVLGEEGCDDLVTLTFEHGIFGGVSAQGIIFGAAKNHRAVVDAPDIIDFYHAGGLDDAFLGFAEVDVEGNVNVSKYNGVVMGSGGFTDIAQCAKTVVFCGTMTAGGLEASVNGGRLHIGQEGITHKFVRRVGQVTFNGQIAIGRGHRVMLVTERAVFEFRQHGWVLTELASGVTVDDLRAVMDFDPEVASDLRQMDPAVFIAERIGLRDRWLGSATARAS
jgi:acyl CoA:acetate/3-ketoacid CoA transferase